jgi:uncharacterized membrane protein YadS
MSQKTLVKIAIVMVVVFGVITLTYPMIFTPDPVVPEALPEQQTTPAQ